MKSIFFSILKKPYPLEEQKPAQIKLAFLFGLVVFLIMFFIKPFGFNGNNQMLLKNSIYGAVLTTVAIGFDFMLLFPLFSFYFKEEKWTIGREIIFTLIIIITIASFNVIAGKLFFGVTLSILNWLRTIFFTALIGIAPAIVSILLNQARLLKKYRKEVGVINNELKNIVVEPNVVLPPNLLTNDETNVQAEENTLVEQTNNFVTTPTNSTVPHYITITAENLKETLQIAVHNFIAATSADNYIKVYYIENDCLKTAIIRSTLKKVAENFTGYHQLFRCHRTAIINITKINKVSGTAQGYKLKMAFMQEEVPVSRNLNKELKQQLTQLNVV